MKLLDIFATYFKNYIFRVYKLNVIVHKTLNEIVFIDRNKMRTLKQLLLHLSCKIRFVVLRNQVNKWKKNF